MDYADKQTLKTVLMILGGMVAITGVMYLIFG
jgi:hypothetical protein